MSMKWDAGGMKNPLARARGLGSARDGVGGWVRLRVTAAANVLLAIWFIWFLKETMGASHSEFTERLADPRNAIMMILLIISVFYHATLGCREIVEDYFHIEWLKLTKIAGIYMFFFAAAVACIFSVSKIAFTVGV